jgi:hypothetical protein
LNGKEVAVAAKQKCATVLVPTIAVIRDTWTPAGNGANAPAASSTSAALATVDDSERADEHGHDLSACAFSAA